MKNFFPLFVLVVLTVVGCKAFDKELADKMRADLDKLEGMAPAFETLNTNISNMNNQLGAVPEAMKTENNAEYQNLLRISDNMSQKYQASAAEYNDLAGKFKNLVADYTAGKIKTEDVKKEYEMLSLSIQGMADVLDRLNQRVDAMQAEYAKMSATWNAKAEETAK